MTWNEKEKKLRITKHCNGLPIETQLVDFIKKGEMFMGRNAGFFLGLLGLILPGYLFYMQYQRFSATNTFLIAQGFFYTLGYLRDPTGGDEIYLRWISSEWLTPENWGGNTEFYLYLASFALAVLGLLVILGSGRGGAFSFLLAGLANLGLLLLVYSNLVDYSSLATRPYPIPVGAIFLLLACIVGMRD